MAKPAITKSEDAAAAAGALLPLIRRVAPGALEKAELVEQSGMETDEIREGLEFLTAEGKIEETEDGYKLAGAEAKAVEATAEEQPGGADPGTPMSVPGVQKGYRATMEVTVTYGGPERDEEAMAEAAAMEERIANLVHGEYPDAVVAVEVKKVEAYQPRVIFQDGGGSED